MQKALFPPTLLALDAAFVAGSQLSNLGDHALTVTLKLRILVGWMQMFGPDRVELTVTA